MKTNDFLNLKQYEGGKNEKKRITASFHLILNYQF